MRGWTAVASARDPAWSTRCDGGKECGLGNEGLGGREIDGWRLERGWGVLRMVPMHVAGAWCEVGAAGGCSGGRVLPMRVQGGYRGCGMARWLGWRSMGSDGVRWGPIGVMRRLGDWGRL